jgi:hypothetical protein
MTFQNCLYPADTAPELDSLRIDFGSLLFMLPPLDASASKLTMALVLIGAPLDTSAVTSFEANFGVDRTATRGTSLYI